ncbi:MAG: hypothetical protein AAB597_01670 [Patescibacteria group bacterium]
MQKIPRERILLGIFFVLILIVFGYQTKRSLELSFPAMRIAQACDNGSDLFCLRDWITDEILEHGLQKGFSLIREIYFLSPGFRPECTTLGYYLASELILRDPTYVTKSLLPPESAICNYTFYNEYARLLVLDDRLEDAQGLCVRAGNEMSEDVPAIRRECFRGFGRGLPSRELPSRANPQRLLKNAILLCEKLSPGKQEKDLCESGVYNQTAHETRKGTYGLSVNYENPGLLCESQPKELRSRCLGNTRWVPPTESDDQTISKKLESELRLFATSTPEIASRIVFTIGYDEGRWNLTKDSPQYAGEIRECFSLSEKYRRECVHGLAMGLAKHGAPGQQYLQILKLCLTASRTPYFFSNKDCSEPALSYLKGDYSRIKFHYLVCPIFSAILGSSCFLEPTS